MTDISPDNDIVPSIFEALATDAEAEENGKWFENVFPGVSLKLRRGTSKKAISARQSALQRHTKRAKNGVFSEKVQKDILIEALVNGVIVDWKGNAMRDAEGAIAYSPEAAIRLLTELPNLRMAVATISDNMDNFRVEVAEELAGN